MSMVSGQRLWLSSFDVELEKEKEMLVTFFPVFLGSQHTNHSVFSLISFIDGTRTHFLKSDFQAL